MPGSQAGPALLFDYFSCNWIGYHHL